MPKNADRTTSRRNVLRLMGSGAAAAFLAACGAPSGNQTAGSTAAGSTAAGSTAAGSTAAVSTQAAEGQITIWSRTGDLFQVLDAAIPAFNRTYPNIKVNHVAVETNTIPPTLATGVDVPDGAFIEDEFLGVIAPHLHDITDWMQPYVNDLVPYKVRVNTHDGRIKGIPYDVDPGLLYYRADIVEQHGVNVDNIKTYDDLITVAKEMQAKDANLKPIRLENAPGVIILWMAMLSNQQGSGYVDAQGNLLIETEPWLNIMQWLDRVVKEGVGNRVDIFSPDDIAASDQGIHVFAPTAIWYNYGIGNLFPESKGKWRATRLPAWQEGGARAAAMGGSSFIIPAKGQNPYLAWLFYEFMMLTEEGYKAAFGPNQIYAGGIDTLLPSYIPAYDEPLMTPPAGLGGQDLWALATAVAKDIPDTVNFPTWYSQSADIIGANVQRLYDQQLTPEQVLERSAADIKSNLIR